MTVSNVNEFKSHGSSTFHRVLIATGRAKAAVTAERDKLEIAAMLTAIHGTAEGGVTTMDHFVLHRKFTEQNRAWIVFLRIVCYNKLSYLC